MALYNARAVRYDEIVTGYLAALLFAATITQYIRSNGILE